MDWDSLEASHFQKYIWIKRRVIEIHLISNNIGAKAFDWLSKNESENQLMNWVI